MILTDEYGLQREYTQVKRPAKVGERVVIVNAVKDAKRAYGYDNGEVYTVEVVNNCGDPNIWPDGTEDSEIFLEDSEYVVLEPVAAPPERIISWDSAKILGGKSGETVFITSDNATQRTLDGLLDTVTRLTLRVAELERKASAKKSIGDMTVIDEIAQKLGDAMRAPIRTKPKTRDDVIELAKADVVALAFDDIRNDARRNLSGKEGPFYRYDSVYCTYAEFIVNREKRTAVCLLRGYESHDVLARGKSRCAPDDCFNVHIGKAIALRRALGLDVPEYYVNVPQPTEIRVGDIVRYAFSRGFLNLTVVPSYKDCGRRPKLGSECAVDSVAAIDGRIIDDSRTDNDKQNGGGR